ncbi:hypothetical protein ACJROX_05575 [Pseudalkalibacillus sp. A8]|uniref:hypothetical protein n=1 Tax=Pseudalkalibacillus sp. A8 TaxID=3382641 RepID=UPI0038B438AC
MSAFLNELNEAISAGNLVDQSLGNAVEFLEKAKGWGTFDLLGGGTISGAIKHNHIDRATEYIHQAQSRMRQFQKELSDIEGEADIQVNIPGLLKFADFFFDGLISDWMVQGRIEESLDQTKAHHGQINAILSDLKGQVTQKRRELEEIQTERKKLVESV